MEHKPWCLNRELNLFGPGAYSVACICATPHYKRDHAWVTDTRRVGMGYHLGRRTADRVNAEARASLERQCAEVEQQLQEAQGKLDMVRQHAYETGFDDGVDHGNLSYKYPSLEQAWAEYLEDIKVNHYRYHTAAELAAVTSDRDRINGLLTETRELLDKRTEQLVNVSSAREDAVEELFAVRAELAKAKHEYDELNIAFEAADAMHQAAIAAAEERAGNRCEKCGVANHAVGFRGIDGRFVAKERERFVPDDWLATANQIRIVLTIAHLNHDTGDNRE